MKREDIHLRDPFVLVHNGKYYLYGSRGSEVWGDSATGLDVYISEDMENWEEKTVFERTPDFWATMHYWAPEVYFYKDAFYMFASFKAEGVPRGTLVLRAESPEGPFEVWSEGRCVTPEDWECLDGTLYIEDGVPYMIFCHEWVQVTDGEIWAVRMTEDLKRADGDPFMLFRASEAPWIVPGGKDNNVYVTDGPFMYRTKEGRLLMLWSSLGEEGYTEAIAYSDNGRIDGKWIQQKELLFKKDGGHGMIFKSLDGKLMVALHSPNKHPNERPAFIPIKEENGTLAMA